MLLHLNAPFSICYKDEELEWITIDSDSELLTGIELTPVLLRLKIEGIVHAPTLLTNPTQNELINSDEGGKKWRKNRENDDINSEEKDKKWRKYRKNRENDDVNSEEKDKKWRKYRKECRKAEKKDNDDTLSGEKDCKKWRKYRKVCRENDDTVSEQQDSKKWRKYRKNCNDDTVSDEKGCKKWRQENGESQKERRQKRWEGPRGRHAWKSRHGMDNSDSDSIEENRPVEEIKKEINSLKEEVGVLVAKKKGLWEELVAFKTQIKTLRQNEGARDEILKLREQIFEKKRVAREYHWQITNSKNRIWKLKNALVMKVD